MNRELIRTQDSKLISKITTLKQAVRIMDRYKHKRERCRLISHCVGVLRTHGFNITSAMIGDYMLSEGMVIDVVTHPGFSTGLNK